MNIPAGAAILFEPGSARRMGLARGRGPGSGSSGRAVAWLLVEGGEGELEVGGRSVRAESRRDVFDGPGWSALIAPGEPFHLSGDLSWTIVWRPEPAGETATHIIDPVDVTEEHRGSGATERTVRTYLQEGSLICGETLNPPGGWSSWPPHRHEHDELYLYRFETAGGFGVQLRDDVATVVRDGSAEYLESGYHPVVAAPSARMYYLWALAGASTTLVPEIDPLYA